MHRLLAELTAALRHLRRSPGFALLAVAMLALGIGANVAIFSIFQSIILRPLPYPEQERLVGFKSLNSAKALTQPALSLTDFRDFKERATSYSALAAFRPDFAGYAPAGADPVQLVCGLVTEEFLPVFGVTPLLGRGFQPDEFSLGNARTVILSQSAWRRHFAARASVIGETIILNNEPATIIGVMAGDFREPEFVDVWLPFAVEAPENLARDSRFWATIGRLKPGVALSAAQAEATTIAATLATEFPNTNRGWSIALQPLLEMRVGGLRSSLLLLVGAVGLVPRSSAIGVDGPALAFALTVSVSTGLIFGLLPAWQVLRANVNEMLKSGGSRGGSSRFASSVQGALIAGQVALTLVVLTGAGLLMKSLLTMQRTATGFDPVNLLTLRISPPPSRWDDFQQLGDYYERVLAEVRREPGVMGVTLNSSAPLSGITLRYPFWVEGRPVEEGNADEAVFNSVTTGYFHTLRVPVLRGRDFAESDDQKAGASRPVCIINAALAKRLFGDADPIGKRIRTLPWMVRGYREVVGVVGDVKQNSQADDATPQLYVPQRQSPWFFTTVLVRTNGASAATIQAAMRRADPTLTMSVRTMEESIALSATQPRLRAALFGLFACVALGLSAFGIYASMAFSVGQRTREIGVRMALGAAPGDILRWVLVRAALLAGLGVAVGLAGALGAARLLRGLLYGVEPADPLVLAVLLVFLPAVVLAAAFLPAVRAARLNPTQALQTE